MFKRNSIAWLAVAAVGFIGSALPALAQLEMQHIGTPVVPVIDGDLSDWAGAADFTHSDFNSGFGDVIGAVPEADQKVEAWVGWNDNTEMVYVAGRVVDNDFGTNSTPDDPSIVWRSDGMEVYINVGTERQQYVLNTSATQGVSIFPAGTAKPMGVLAAAQRLENADGTFTYTYEMGIPGWTVLNVDRHNFKRGQVIGFRIVFSDFTTAANADAGTFHLFNSLGLPESPFAERDFTLTGPPGTGMTISRASAGGARTGRSLAGGIPGLTAKPVVTDAPSSWGEIKKAVDEETAE